MIVNETELLKILPEYNTRHHLTELTVTHLAELGDAILNAQKKSFGGVRTPIIAGGAVRDTVFGCQPKDFDIFFDVSSIHQEDRQDATLLFGLRIMDELEKLPNFRLFKGVNLVEKGQNYGEPENLDPSWKEFYVADTNEFNGEEWGLWIMEGEHHPVVQSHLQFVGHVDKRLTDDPMTFLDSFDYPLVKCFYDPVDRLYKFQDEFVEAMKTRSFSVDSPTAFSRASGWENLWGMGFDIKKNYEEPKPVKTTPVTGSYFNWNVLPAEIQTGPILVFDPLDVM